MTTTTTRQHANVYPRKRSISEKDSPTFAVSLPSSKKIEFTVPSTPSPTTYSPRTLRKHAPYSRRSSIDKPHRRYPPRSNNMDSPNSPALAAPIPPFLSVYESNSSTSSFEVLNHITQPLSSSKNPPNDTCFSPIDAPTFNPFHQPRNSTSTSASDSTESSPTTTVSLDSSSMTEPSPAPSPQSPSSMNFAMDASRFTPLDGSTDTFLSIPRRPSTPGKGRKNLKNLAVNTSAAFNLGRGLATAPIRPEPEKQSSAPASPLFVKPPTPPRRKMGNISLTIMTPANSTLPNSIVPPTPSIKRPATLRHFQSSPSLPLFTSGLGPAGGMKLPNERPPVAPRGFAQVPMEEDEDEDEEQNFDVPQSQEEKPESYPNGPIRIYESGIDLYYEPSVEVASKYDVIFNVASEVKNPFDVALAEARLLMPLPPSNNVGIIAEPSTTGSPTTPKATPITTNPPAEAFVPGLPLKRPEYIHIPWEHNTDIVPDLYHLVRTIDDRVNQGKTVLVHCQCGVSRSASLIVAYGLYKNPDMSVQDAYNAVKKRSKWIGPNMSLIMQLQEFKNGLGREYQSQDMYGFRKSTTMPLSSILDVFNAKSPSAPPTPTAEQSTSPVPLSPSAIGPFSAAPIESTSGSFWDAAFRQSGGSQQTNNNLAIPGVSLVTDTPYVDPKGHIVPIVTMLQNDKQPYRSTESETTNSASQNSWKTPNFTRPLPFRKEFDQDTQMTDASSLEPLVSPRSTEFHMASIVPPPQVESFDHFNILSPKTSEFPSSITTSLAPESPPPPNRSAPPPPIERPMGSLDSIFSPTSASFPSILPLNFSGPTDNQSSDFSLLRSSQRIDSLVPQLSPPPPPSQQKERRLRPKISAPNLSQSLRLQKMQDDIASHLPKRPAEAEEALLSPRATTFAANPFHNLPVTITEESIESSSKAPEVPDSPTTPNSNTDDPRSPAQFMLSPITRNIWGMI